MICCAVVDTNVLVAALLSSKEDSATVLILNKVLAGEIIPVYSSTILNEYREVLLRPKFNFNSRLINYLISAIEKFGILTEPSPSGITLSDSKDLPFYETVLAYQEEHTYLVTGNIRHFPKKPYIVTPREMLNILENSAPR